ncbi:DUF2637 domain-containing protein [Streptomyces lavendofoliae]|uniref:DUF2637 domain-containing protein n=1 Tax=Streptomyces lavendofoliae TaxID=67314 RepID=A0A918I2P4_9ACTN|nr:DUF2637 domain-containing protein [Streptomyces lavendofoliae]GGU60065.1 hypothetical protein GCM10010274_56130 [Streptomyces lavendofoliae]
MAAMQLTRTHRILIGVVITGAVIIAGIGFAGSYAAVRELAEKKGFGDFSLVFPIGIDAGICVLLALDLLLTWLRIPFPLLRQTAWLLTAATIAFNGAASWPDPLGVGMHAVIPVLFVVSVEAARHAIGRIADITADKHMEGVRLTRWLLSPVPTFRLWRRMKLWELRSYEQVIKLEQDRLIYQARLQARFGRAWRRRAPVEALMPLRLAKYGVPLAETAPAGLAAAGIDPVLLPPNPLEQTHAAPELELPQHRTPDDEDQQRAQDHPQPQPHPYQESAAVPAPAPGPAHAPGQVAAPGPAPAPGPEAQPVPPSGPQQAPPPEPQPDPQPEVAVPANHVSPWFAAAQLPQDAQERGYAPPYADGQEPAPAPVAPGPGTGVDGEPLPDEVAGATDPDAEEFGRLAYPVFKQYVDENNDWPSVDVLDIHLADGYGIRHPLSAVLLRRLLPEFKNHYQAELAADHIA